jgi:hypothetical protein
MSSESVTNDQRFTRDQECPVCRGIKEDPQGTSTRCYGFMSGSTAWCTREEYAKGIKDVPGAGYPHKLAVWGRVCPCGRAHAVPAWWKPRDTKYPYVENGVIVANKHRLDWRTGDKDMRWELPDGTAGLGGRRAETFPLFGSDVLDAKTTKTIVIVEGEKKVEMLRPFGIGAVGVGVGAPGTHGVDAFKILKDFDEVICWGDSKDKGPLQQQANVARLAEIGHPNIRIVPGGTPAPDDFINAGNGQAQIVALLNQAVPATARAGTSPSSKPTITISGNLSEMTDEAWDVIVAANTGPSIFQRSTVATRLERDDDGFLMTKQLTEPRLRHELARAATFQMMTDNGPKEVHPPMPVVTNMLAVSQLPLPVLDRIVEVPTFASTGRLRTEPGYDPDGRTFYMPPANLVIPRVPERPTEQEILEAVQLLREVFRDFTVVGEADTAHAIALMLQPFVRDMIRGPVPNHIFDAPAPGTGKTLMARAALLPALGRQVVAMGNCREEDEWRKRIGAKLMAAAPVIFMDNVKTGVPFDSAALASAITSYPKWEERRLGMSEIPQLPVRAPWVTTGNNITLSMELARRSVRTRLVAPDERPWLRTGWAHDPLEDWILAERPRIIHACLMLGAAWIAAGMPAPEGKVLGMFESWVGVIGGILEVAKIPGFLDNIEDLYAEADQEGGEQREFFIEWRKKFKTPVTAVELVTLEIGLPARVVEAADRKAKLGYYLRGIKDKKVRLEKGGPTYTAEARRNRLNLTEWFLKEGNGS